MKLFFRPQFSKNLRRNYKFKNEVNFSSAIFTRFLTLFFFHLGRYYNFKNEMSSSSAIFNKVGS